MMSAVTTAVLSPSSFPSEREWHLDVLEKLSGLVGCYKSGIRRPTGAAHQWTERGCDKSAIPLYNAYFQKFDHGRALGDAEVRPNYIVSTTHRFRGRLTELRQSEFYCDFLQPFGFYDGITLSTRRRHHHKGSTLYLWHERELTEAQRSRTIAILGLLAPAFRSGMGATARLRCGNESFHTVVDSLTEGCALFTHSGVLVHQNPALTALYSESAGGEPLRGAVMSVAASMREAYLWGRSVTAGPRAAAADVCDSTGTYRVMGCLLGQSPSENQTAILVTVLRVRYAGILSQSETLKERFGLTQRESEVALLLVARRTNQEIATALGTSAHTARHHTENVMRKMGTASRIEVATMLGGLSA
jgi:DNA-binding CsgD family transcriptional regulator